MVEQKNPEITFSHGLTKITTIYRTAINEEGQGSTVDGNVNQLILKLLSIYKYIFYC